MLTLGPPPRPPPASDLQIKAAIEELQKEAMTLGQAVYGQQGGAPGEAAPGGEAGGEPGSSSSGPKGDDVIDAEFTDSNDKK